MPYALPLFDLHMSAEIISAAMLVIATFSTSCATSIISKFENKA